MMNHFHHVTRANTDNFANNSSLLLLHPNKKLWLNPPLLLTRNAISTCLLSIDLRLILLLYRHFITRPA